MGFANQWTSFVDTMQLEGASRHWQRARFFAAVQFNKLKNRRPLQLSPQALDAYRTVIAGKIAHIERLPSRYRKEVTTAVWTAVMRGYDSVGLAGTLHDRFGFSLERARSIAAAQCRMAAAVIGNATRLENGVLKALWISGAKCGERGHAAFNRQRYALQSGAQLDGKWVLPAGEPACDCTSADLGD